MCETSRSSATALWVLADDLSEALARDFACWTPAKRARSEAEEEDPRAGPKAGMRASRAADVDQSESRTCSGVTLRQASTKARRGSRLATRASRSAWRGSTSATSSLVAASRASSSDTVSEEDERMRETRLRSVAMRASSWPSRAEAEVSISVPAATRRLRARSRSWRVRMGPSAVLARTGISAST